jgi:hypothetical protein
MDLQTLATKLRQQATAQSTLVLDDSVFSKDVLAQIRTAFALAADANLTVTGVKPTDIPDPTAGGTLTISAGQAAVLKQTNVPVALTFTAPGGALNAVIVATMSAKWKFTDSFGALEVYPFNHLTVSDARFVFSTVAEPNYPWPGEPQSTIALDRGLNLLSRVSLTSFSPLTALLGALFGGSSLKFHGGFSPVAGAELPVGKLVAPLGSSSFSVGVAPNTLSLSAPRVAVRLKGETADNPLPQVDLLVEATFQDALDVAIVLPTDNTALEISATPKPGKGSIASLIESLPGGRGFSSYIPSELNQLFATFGLKTFGMIVTPQPKVTYLSLSVGAVKPWKLIENVLELEDLTLHVQTFDPSGENLVQVSFSASAAFWPSVFDGRFDFAIELQKTTSWQVSTISGAYFGGVNLGKLVGGLSGNPNTVPEVLKHIEFSNFGVTATRSSPASPFTYTIFGSVRAAFPVFSRTLSAELSFVATKTPSGFNLQLAGSLAIGEQDFTLSLNLGAAKSKLTATWTNHGTPFGFHDIAQAFGWDSMPELPEALDLALTDAEFTYDITGGTVALRAHSEHYGQILFASLVTSATSPNPKKRVYLFSLDLPLHVQLSDLPVVGDKLPANLQLGVQDLEILIVSDALAADDVKDLNTLITDTLKGTALIPTKFAKGLTFATKLQMGANSQPVVVPITGGAKPKPPALAGPRGSDAIIDLSAADVPPASASVGTSAPGANPPAAPSDSATDYRAAATWFNIEKSFGPVQFQRIGLQYENKTLFFLLDASLSFSALSLSCQGLGIGSPLTSFKPKPHLDGLAVSFSSGPVTISGGLLVVPENQRPKNVAFQYIGAVTISVKPWMIMGMASYAKVDDSPSFFLFAQVMGKIGGPPAFFITGFMGGFGYNSQITVPPVEEISTFPFIAGLDNPALFGSQPTPMSVMKVLAGDGTKPAVVTPTVGANWIAAGILFRSFELVLGRALLVVEFGHDFQVSLLGLATASLPQGATTDAYAFVELQLEVIFRPSAGYFGLTASLTNSSFVITKDCHLTGGFAFCLWFGPNEHAGDFVVTVGGYHPAFTKPAWYPTVAPVGFNWQVSSSVTIKGGAYFALTPSAIMAGGGLEVLFHSGAVKAWFTAYANILIMWKPFHFEADVGISLGAEVTVDLLFTTVTLSFELGATLELWGPPTGGIVHVHLYIISFSIPFGASSASARPEPLKWGDFASLLPQPNASKAPKSAVAANASIAALNAASADSATTNSAASALVLGTQVNRGLMRQNDAGTWFVRADELQFSTTTAVPPTSVTFAGPGAPPLAHGAKPVTPPQTISIRPMGVASATSVHSITLTSIDEKRPVDLTKWTHVPLSGNLPEALWGAPLQPKGDSYPAPPASSATVPGMPTGIQLIAPPAVVGASPGEMNLTQLVIALGGGYQPLVPASQADPIPAPVIDNTTIAQIASTLGGPAAAIAQQGIVAALTAVNAAPPTTSRLTGLADQAGETFSQPPLRAA